MPLIFLDTPQIDVLEAARRTDPRSYRSFRDRWRRGGCFLVITLTQQRELRRYSDDPRRMERYHVLKDLAPLRSDVNWRSDSHEPRALIHREIVGAVLRQGLRTEKGPSAERLAEWADVLPGYLNADEAGLLQVLEKEIPLDFFNLEYSALQFAAMADRDSHAKTGKRVRDIPSAPLSPGQLSECRAEMEKAFNEVGDRIGPSPMPELVAQSMSQSLDLVRAFLGRAGEIGLRGALLEHLHTLGVDESKLAKFTTDELSNLSVFQSQVRFVAHNFLNASDEETDSLARTLVPADCPGSWLEWALRGRVRSACADPRPNHLSDAERLAYLPYVDLLLTDREMAELTNQIRRDKSTPSQVRDARPPQSVSSSLPALRNALDLVCGGG